jgi:hypothetical protein
VKAPHGRPETDPVFSEAQSALLNAKLILVLSNHIGDLDVLRKALAVARADIDASAP